MAKKSLADNTHPSDCLRLENISISFGGVKVLSEASFSLRENEIHAIVGKNGAGKSSLMKVLTGVYSPNEGNVTIFEESVKFSSGKTVSQQQVAMVYQELSLVPSMTVAQNIFLAHHPYNRFGFIQDKKAAKHVRKLLAQVGVPHVSPGQLVEDLSTGEAQLVEIAKAISANPKIIVFDEPTAALSDLEITFLFKTIKSLRSEGHSIIYITHYLEDVMKICDRVTVLRNGKVISTNSVSASSIENIVSDMLGEEAELRKGVHSRVQRNQEEEPYLDLKEASTTKVGPITMEAYLGEIIGIVGLLGSGRTEILEMIYGLSPLKSGSINIAGKKASVKTPRHASKHGIMLVPEERRTQGLVMDFDIEENVALPNLTKLASYGVIDTKKRRALADEVISSIQVKTTGRKQIVRFLSGGNQQKVVIGKCLASSPKILLLDDPTFGVDIQAKTEIMKIIREYVKSGNIVLFISSEFSEIASFCDRVYIVKKQRIKNELSNQALTEEDLLVEVQ